MSTSSPARHRLAAGPGAQPRLRAPAAAPAGVFMDIIQCNQISFFGALRPLPAARLAARRHHAGSTLGPSSLLFSSCGDSIAGTPTRTGLVTRLQSWPGHYRSGTSLSRGSAKSIQGSLNAPTSGLARLSRAFVGSRAGVCVTLWPRSCHRSTMCARVFCAGAAPVAAELRDARWREAGGCLRVRRRVRRMVVLVSARLA